MKKKVVKKYAHELLKSMRYWSNWDDMGYAHFTQSKSKALKGKRARQLTRNEVIDYINNFIRPLKPFYDDEHAKFNKNRLYIIACYEGGKQNHRDDFIVHCMYSHDDELPNETWFVYGQWVYRKPEMTQHELSLEVERFMRSIGYELVVYGSFRNYVNSTGRRIPEMFAFPWYNAGKEIEY